MTAPASSNWQIERSRLERQYFSSFTVHTSSAQNSIEAIKLTHYPSDPDFDKSLLPNGLPCIFTVHKNYDDRAKGAPFVSLRIESEDVPPAIKRIIVEICTVYVEKQVNVKQELVRGVLKYLDGKFVEIFNNWNAKARNDKQWSNEEQKRLENALVWYRRVVNPVEKWRKIGEYVKSKTARECADRFRECREQVLRESKEAEASDTTGERGEEKGDTDEGESSKQLATATSAHNEAPAPTLPTGGSVSCSTQNDCELSIEGLTLKGISVVCSSKPCLQVVCERCKTSGEMSVSLAKNDLSLGSCGVAKECEKCRNKFLLHYHPHFAFSEDPVLGAFDASNCIIVDALHSEFIALCGTCSSEIWMGKFQNGTAKDATCRQCYSKLTVKIEQFRLKTHSKRLSTEVEGIRLGLKNIQLRMKFATDKATERKRKIKEDFIKVGTPLVDNGSCKHYKKSHRWLRFPCCGRAFPCDVCHDQASDHVHEWALRMICGFCSREQPYSQKPCTCGHALVAKRSAFWEGGKGCRDKSALSKKDKHKYRS